MSKAMSAREYREHARRVKAKAPTETVTLSSGSVWELRRPDLQGFVMTGRVPQSLLAEGMAAWKKNGTVPTDMSVAKIVEADVVESLIFMREIVREATVNPRFVEIATNDDEIGADEMLPLDFQEIFAWCMGYQGVTGLDGLKSFREGRERGTAADSTDSSELQPEAEPVTAN
jgi:hypothetical protein